MRFSSLLLAWFLLIAGAIITIIAVVYLPQIYMAIIQPLIAELDKMTTGWASVALLTAIIAGCGLSIYWFWNRTASIFQTRKNSSIILGIGTMFDSMLNKPLERDARRSFSGMSLSPFVAILKPSDRISHPEKVIKE